MLLPFSSLNRITVIIGHFLVFPFNCTIFISPPFYHVFNFNFAFLVHLLLNFYSSLRSFLFQLWITHYRRTVCDSVFIKMASSLSYIRLPAFANISVHCSIHVFVKLSFILFFFKFYFFLAENKPVVKPFASVLIAEKCLTHRWRQWEHFAETDECHRRPFTHTHTHTHTYIYIYIYTNKCLSSLRSQHKPECVMKNWIHY